MSARYAPGQIAEDERLAAAAHDLAPWRLWGHYLSGRQWGTVREDYSAGGDAWEFFPFDHAHRRAYRWGEDGIAGLTDRYGFLNLAPAFWNGNDDRLKERLFGLTNTQGDHGEDVKEHWWHIDATPTRSYAEYLPRCGRPDPKTRTRVLARIDPWFAKEQLVLMCREWCMHPSGQLAAYEWKFSDVNPPVLAWAARVVFFADGAWDRAFLVRIFTKLLLNFSWWVNRKDENGSGLFEGGFLGMDNITVFDRSAPLPEGQILEQSDATSWMAFYCLSMLKIAVELARDDGGWGDIATKFFEHFLEIVEAMDAFGNPSAALWDEEDGFFYDVLVTHGETASVKVRSMVGLLPLLGVMNLPDDI